MRQWVKCSVWVCLSLMLWTVAAESAHHHPSRTESLSCSICVVAHSARASVSANPAAPAFAAIGLVREENVIAKAQFDFSELGIRGPPAAL
jgi:hypothetical protein